MAEENLNTEENMKQVQDFLKEQFNSFKDDLIAEYEASRTQPNPAHDPVKEQNERVKEVINPFIEPGLNAAKFAAGDAKDMVSFYINTPDAMEYKDQVEAAFTELAKNGRPTQRNDILKFIKGREYESDPDAFVAKHSERRKRELARAESAADFGSQGGRVKEDHPLNLANFKNLSVEDMEKALEGYTF